MFDRKVGGCQWGVRRASVASWRPFPSVRDLLIAVLVLAGAAPVLSAEAPPNIVFLMADDLGWADVGFHGGTAPTPHLDRLALRGAELMQHYVAPVCSPTRTGLLTGRCWSRFGVTTPQNERALPWETMTLPRALQRVGYRTCLTGKWHLGSRPEEYPGRFGWDYSYGSLAGGVSPWNHRYKTGPYTETWHRNGQLIQEEGHVTDLIVAEALRWLDQQSADAPFFLYVPFTAVHLPIREPQVWLDRVPPTIQGAVAREYCACVMHLDDAVGQILAALERKQLSERTVVVFTSDNGGSTAENAGREYPPDEIAPGALVGDNRPFRGQKGELYEGGTRVPTLVLWPGKIAPRKIDQAVQITDWMPTFCRLAGVTPDAAWAWDGIDLTERLCDDQPLPERPLYAVGPRWQARSLRFGPWKLIVRQTDSAIERQELYNLDRDPGETHDLAAQWPQQVREMFERMTEMARRDNDAAVKAERAF